MFYTFLLVFILTVILIWFIRANAKGWGLIDIPNERSIHDTFIPRGAGIAFYISVICIVPFFYFDLILSYPWTTLALFLIFTIGVLDDIYDTSPKTKFMIIILSTIFLSFDGIIISKLGTFFTLNISLYWFALPFTIFVVSGFTNALNLIDGLDGLAASISVVILATFFWIGYTHHDMFMMMLAGVFIATLFAFLFYNWNPASIFMGDSGSLMLGFIVSVLGIKSLAYIPPVSILFLGAIPILDTLVVMIRRKRAGRSFFSADSCHIHHLFKEVFKENTPKTVLFLVSTQILYSLFGLQLDKEMDQGILLIVFIVNILLLYKIFDVMIEKQKRIC